MRYTPEYSSRFRILKGGKISLVVSALLTATSIVNAADVTISTALTSAQTLNMSVASTDLTMTSAGSITLNASGTQRGIDVSGNPLSQGNTIDINSGGTISVTSTDNQAKGIFTMATMGVYNPQDSGYIVNSGMITVSGYGSRGIHVANMYGSSSIINHGSISTTAGGVSGNTYGITTNELYHNASIVNNGTITATGLNGKRAYGMMVGSLYDDSSIINNATITASSDGSGGKATGIYAANSYGNTNIKNAGTLNVTGTNGAEVYGINRSCNYMSNWAIMENSGTMNVSASGATAWGMYGVYVNDLSDIINSGTLNVTVTNGGGSDNAFGLMPYALYDSASILNSGTITVTASGGQAFGIGGDTVLYDNSTLTNSGTITVNSDVKSYGIKVSVDHDTSSNVVISNSGTIKAKVNGEYDKDGFALHITGNNPYYGTINNTSTGVIKGNLYTDAGTTLNNAGTISLPYNANNANAAHVGIFNQSGTGILEIGLMSDAQGAMEYSQLVADTATFASGSTIKVNVLSTSGNQPLLIGQRMDDVVSAQTLTVGGTLNVTDNSALLNFELIRDNASVNDNLTIDLNIVEGSTISDAVNNGGGGGSVSTAAAALDAINDDIANNPAMAPVIAALNQCATDACVASAVASTTPVQTVSAQVAGTQIMNNVQGIVELRQNSTIGGGLSSGDAGLAEQNLWIKPFGGKGEQENKDGISGFDLKMRGLGIGYDAEYAPNQRSGVAFFYTDADVDVKGVNQTSDVKVYNILGYGNIPLDETNNFLYQAGYAWQKSEGRRTDFMGNTAHSDYTSKAATIDLKLMQTYKIDNALTLHPLLNTTYRHFTTPSYSESGAGALNLNVEEMTSTQLLAGGGFIADYALNKSSYLMFDLSVLYDFHHDSEMVTAAYQGAAGTSFTTTGIDNGPWIYNAGLGYTMKTDDNSELNFMYNYQGQGTTFEVHTISAKYVWKF